MEGIDANKIWMLGVVGAMVVFGIAALIGYYRNPQQDEPNALEGEEVGDQE